jgi:hypothetical protein
MKTLHSVIAIGLVGCLLALPLVEAKALQEAQPPAEPGISDWNNLQQLRVGDKVEVVRTDLSKLKGTFLSFSDEAISLRVGKDEVGVQRPKVFRVSAREHSKRLRNTLIGLGIGAAAGAVVGAAAVAGKPRQAGERRLSMVIGTLMGSGAGAAVGVAIPAFQTIYRAKVKRGGTQP